MQVHYPDQTCNNLAGPASISNNWEMLNSSDPYSGLRIKLNNGVINGVNSTVTMELTCDVNGTAGAIQFSNINEFDPASPTNLLKASTKESNL